MANFKSLENMLVEMNKKNKTLTEDKSRSVILVRDKISQFDDEIKKLKQAKHEASSDLYNI